MAVSILVYLSRMTAMLESQAIDELVHQASIKNKRADITGVLLVVGDHFVQFLEGPDNAVDDVFKVIKRDVRHCDVSVMLKETAPERIFGEWNMTCLNCRQELDLKSDADKQLAKNLEEIVEKRGLSIEAMKEMIVTIPTLLLKQQKKELGAYYSI